MRNLLKKHWEFVLYALFGIGTVVTDEGLYSLLVGRVGIRWANLWGWLGAMLFAFVTNKYFVFHTGNTGKRGLFVEFLQFLAVRLFSLLLELQGVEFLVKRGMNWTILGVTGGVAKVLVTVVVIIINYVCSKFIIFRRRATA